MTVEEIKNKIREVENLREEKIQELLGSRSAIDLELEQLGYVNGQEPIPNKNKGGRPRKDAAA